MPETPPPVISAELLLFRLDGLDRHLTARDEALDKRLDEMEQTAKDSNERLIEIGGRSGRDGRLGNVEEAVKASAASQGKRIGDLEVDVGKLKQTRAQLTALAALGMLILGALITLLVKRLGG